VFHKKEKKKEGKQNTVAIYPETELKSRHSLLGACTSSRELFQSIRLVMDSLLVPDEITNRSLFLSLSLSLSRSLFLQPGLLDFLMSPASPDLPQGIYSRRINVRALYTR